MSVFPEPDLQAGRELGEIPSPLRIREVLGDFASGVTIITGSDRVEPVEHIADAVLDLVTADPREVTGLVVTSQGYLDARGRSTYSLDGRRVLFERRPAAS